MTAKDAKKIAAAWIAEQMPDDLRGRAFQVVNFPDDETCRFFYDDRWIGLHQMITKAIASAARKRGAVIVHAVVTRTDYERDKSACETPRAFIERCHRFL